MKVITRRSWQVLLHFVLPYPANFEHLDCPDEHDLGNPVVLERPGYLEFLGDLIMDPVVPDYLVFLGDLIMDLEHPEDPEDLVILDSLEVPDCPEHFGHLEDLVILEDPDCLEVPDYLDFLVNLGYPDCLAVLGYPEVPDCPEHFGHLEDPEDLDCLVIQ